MGVFTASAIGYIIANRSFISGAAGGCQAEVGSATAMAAGTIVELKGGTPLQAINATAIAMKSLLGLVCDPVAGLATMYDIGKRMPRELRETSLGGLAVTETGKKIKERIRNL